TAARKVAAAQEELRVLQLEMASQLAGTVAAAQLEYAAAASALEELLAQEPAAQTSIVDQARGRLTAAEGELAQAEGLRDGMGLPDEVLEAAVPGGTAGTALTA